MVTNNPQLSEDEILAIKIEIARKWKDPVARIESTFNIRNSKGELLPYIVPEPQKQMIRDGILGKARNQIKLGIPYISVTNKGRQMGFSVINAAEAILIAQDYPNTMIYYVATTIDQAKDWMMKMQQLIQDSNSFPEELGGHPILNIQDIKKIFEKQINNTMIVGLAANPGGIRGKTSIAVYFDEAAWALRTKDIAHETWKALQYFISQGGSARIQSTPRTSDEKEFFWGMFQKAVRKEGGYVAYECPVIENWKDLDLDEPLYIELNDKIREMQSFEPMSDIEKQELRDIYSKKSSEFIITDDYIKQPAKVLYDWKSLQHLENDRVTDKQMFMQEYLCQPIDETLKVIQSAWIEANISEDGEWWDRKDSANSFQMTIDLAQINDVTAIVVTEKVIEKFGKNVYPIFYQRYVEQSQTDTPTRVKLAADIYERFKPEYISIDETGDGGITFKQYLEKEFVDRGYNPRIIKGVTFTSQNKEVMANGFKVLCQPNDSIYETFTDSDNIVHKIPKNRYRFLKDKGNKTHSEMISHIKRVEKEVLQTTVRYSGKRYGRDDFFWSAAQLIMWETIKANPKAAFGRTSAFSTTITSKTEQKSKGKEFIFNANKKRWETKLEIKDEEKKQFMKQKSLLEQRNYTKNLKFAYDCLRNSKMVCKTQKRVVNPIECSNPEECCNSECPAFSYVTEISQRYDVKIEDLYRIFTKFYKQ